MCKQYMYMYARNFAAKLFGGGVKPFFHVIMFSSHSDNSYKSLWFSTTPSSNKRVKIL